MSSRKPGVLFFTQGRRVPSSRFRVQQIVPRLRDAGWPCTIAAPHPSVHGDIGWSWVHGKRRELLRPLSVISRLFALPHIHNHEIVFIQRPLVRYGTIALEMLVTRWRPSIFDMDDALFHNAFGLEGIQIRRIVDRVRHVIVGNSYLADFVNRPEKTTIIPTVVDTDRYQPRPDPDGQFTIGWTGISSNLRELDLIAKPLARVLAETKGKLLIVADRCDVPWLKKLPMEFVRWSPQTEVDALSRVHVGIMPLVDRPYNRGKCGFKLIQYMARGIPVVATPLGANAEIVRDGVDGWHARSPERWVEALIEMARNPERRQRSGIVARERIEQHYSIDAVVPLYLEVLERVAREVPGQARPLSA